MPVNSAALFAVKSRENTGLSEYCFSDTRMGIVSVFYSFLNNLVHFDKVLNFLGFLIRKTCQLN